MLFIDCRFGHLTKTNDYVCTKALLAYPLIMRNALYVYAPTTRSSCHYAQAVPSFPCYYPVR